MIFEKQPYEVWDTYYDFSEVLGSGETITDFTFTSRIEDTGIDSTTAIKEGNGVVVGGIVYQKIKGGADGERHVLTYRIITSLTNKWEGDHRLLIAEH